MRGDISAPDFFEEYSEFGAITHLAGSTVASPEDLFSILEALDGVSELPPATPLGETVVGSKEMIVVEMMSKVASQKPVSSPSGFREYSETELVASPEQKRRRLTAESASEEEAKVESQRKVSHIAVERNRRKQMNEQLAVLRSLMPCFYAKRGDQATIIEGVVQYIKELQQLVQSLEAKKQRKVYTEVLSPRFNATSPRPSSVPSPRKPPLSPRLAIPISPRTPQQPSSPYKPWLHQPFLSPTMPSSPSPTSIASTTISNIDNNAVTDVLVANSRSAVADVEVKFSGPNLLLKTTSPRMPGQACKIVSALEDLSLEILHVSIGTAIDGTMLNSFTIKIGIECQLSAEELAHQIHQTFC